MTLKQAIIAELKMEGASTRKMLERVPMDNKTWRPHEKSMPIGNLANHVAELPTWIPMILNTNELDLAASNYKPQIPDTAEELTAKLDKNVTAAVAALENFQEEGFSELWTLKRGDVVFFTQPKGAVLRSFSFNHLVHHRGQISVYLRLLGIPVPGMYGPSADEGR